jgi:MMPL family
MLADAHISPRVMKPLNVLVEHSGNAQQVAAKLRSGPGVIGASAPPTVDRDFVHALFASFPYVLAFVLILLARAFRSTVLAIKAVLLNVLSLVAAFGIVVFVFQQGHGSSLWNIEATQSIAAYIP